MRTIFKTIWATTWQNQQNECAPSEDRISLGIRPVLSESSLCAQWVAKDPSFLHADSQDSDQTGQMPRLIWVFAGCTLILLVLSCHGSFCHIRSVIVQNIFSLQNFIYKGNKKQHFEGFIIHWGFTNLHPSLATYIPYGFGHEVMSMAMLSHGHVLPTSDSSRALVSYWRQYGHLGSLPRNNVDRLTDGRPYVTRVPSDLKFCLM